MEWNALSSVYIQTREPEHLHSVTTAKILGQSWSLCIGKWVKKMYLGGMVPSEALRDLSVTSKELVEILTP